MKSGKLNTKRIPLLLSCLATLGAAAVPTACAVGSPDGSESEVGTLRMALTGVSNTGHTYRLRFGDFTIEGPTSTSFSTETDPDAAGISVDLAAGEYSITLLDGWVLERDVDGTWQTVEAELISPNPVSFSIQDQGTTSVPFQFDASGDILALGEGTLEVSVEVDDLVCAPGTASCDGDGVNGCETNLETDPANCGACDSVCSTTPGATPACVSGVCETECLPTRADCDLNPANGCETSLSTSIQHCGDCGRVCSVANGTPACTAGMCEVAQCAPGFSNCDSNPQNGCELSHVTGSSCAGVPFGGSISGDAGSPPLNLVGNTERRFQIQVTENSGGATARDLGVRFTLANPPGANYTLRAGCDGCTTVNASGSSVTLRWEEQSVLGVPTNTDSGRMVYVHVVYSGGSSCTDWNLRVEGNVLTGPLTCSAL